MAVHFITRTPFFKKKNKTKKPPKPTKTQQLCPTTNDNPNQTMTLSSKPTVTFPSQANDSGIVTSISPFVAFF
jgi:hypothetical protein